MTAARSILPLLAAIALLGNLRSPASAFRAAPSSAISKRGTPTSHINPAISISIAPTRSSIQLLSSSGDDDAPSNNPREGEIVPLFGEVAVDGSLVVLIPAAAISILGFIFSIVVVFNSGDAFVSEVEVQNVDYAPTKVVEGQCRGLCSSGEEDLDGLRNFMEGLRKN